MPRFSSRARAGNVVYSSGKIQFSVADAALTNTTANTTYTATEGNSTGTVVLATFSDGDPGATLADYSAPTVSWGGTLVGTPTVWIERASSTATASTWCVKGSATYAEKGTYGITVSLNDVDGSSLNSNKVKFKVVDASLTDTDDEHDVSRDRGQ